MTGHRTAPAQRGAITLLVAIGLVTLAALTSLFSARSVLVDQLANRNHAHAIQARLAADAALASAQALIVASAHNSHALFATRGLCPEGVNGLQWQCSDWPLAPHPAMPQARLSATLVRDLVQSPHVIRVHASASMPGHESRAQVRESLFVPVMPPAPTLAAPAALVLNGCLHPAPGAGVRVCPLSRPGEVCSGNAIGPAVQTHFVPDTDRNGLISAAESLSCLALQAANLPAGGDRVGPSTATTRSPCTGAAWRSVLGQIRQEEVQAWSRAQESQGLSASSTPPRTVYWIDSPAPWTQSVGTSEHPVLLVFSALACSARCPHLGAAVRILGTVVLDSGCDDEKVRAWQGGSVEGQLVVESGLPDWRAGAVLARAEGRKAYTLHWPEGMDATRTQRIHGSWSDGTP